MRTFKKIASLVLALTLAATSALTLASCNKKEGSAEWPVDSATGLTELYIGGIGPTTGDNSTYGLSVKQGAQIAIDRINAAGGVNGFKLVYDFEDSQGKPDSAVSAYGKQIDNGMKISLGAVLSGETASVVAAAKQDGILLLTPSASAEDAIAGNDCAFRICFSDNAQGEASAKYISQYNLATKVAVFYASDNNYSAGLYETFKTECANLDLEIVTVQSFTSSTSTDFSTQIAAVKSSGAELLFLPIYAAEAASFLTQAAKTNALENITCFGCDGLDGLLKKIDNTDNAEGVMLLTPFTADAPDASTQAFVSAYQAAYSATPDQFAADGFDAINVIVSAIQEAGLSATDTADFNSRIVAAMTKISVNGITGSMTWAADGNTIKDAKAMIIRKGVAVAYTQE